MSTYRIALLTPLHPQKTGIADYIEEMLPYLRQSFGDRYVIDIFVDDCEPSNTDTVANHRILKIDEFETLRLDYDLYIYQMGNNSFHLKICQYAMKYPGLVVLHDFAIHHLVAFIYLDQLKSDTAYFQAVEDNHGAAARDLAYQRAAKGELGLWETNAIDYPMNRTVTQRALGVIVFSEFARRRLLAYGDHVPIHRVYLHCSGKAKRITPEETRLARNQLGLKLKPDEQLICVFGFIGRPKRPYSILKAAGRLKDAGHRFRLVYVGQLQGDCEDLPKKIKEAGMKDIVSITGFTSAEDFDRYVRAADICISLRYPTMGETSGVLMRALRYWKPSVVTDIGTFQEFRDDTVIKIGYGETEADELTDALRRLMEDPELKESLCKNGIDYAAKHLEPQTTADSFAGFAKDLIAFEAIKNDPMYRHSRDKMLDTYRALGRTDDTILDRAAKTLAELFDGNEE